jgi:hypothetical protein
MYIQRRLEDTRQALTLRGDFTVPNAFRLLDCGKEPDFITFEEFKATYK